MTALLIGSIAMNITLLIIAGDAVSSARFWYRAWKRITDADIARAERELQRQLVGRTYDE